MAIIRRILHLSDPHYGANHHSETRFIQLPNAIANTFSSTDPGGLPLILFSGDLVDDGGKIQFEDVGDVFTTLRNMGYYVYAVPGNHDYGLQGWWDTPESFKWFEKYLFAPGTQIKYPDKLENWGGGPYPEVVIIGLNSMTFEPSFFADFNARGEIGRPQRKKLAEMLRDLQPKREVGEAKIVVLLHHHPFQFPEGEGWIIWNWGKLRDHKEVMKILTGNVDILLFGHRHEAVDFEKDPKHGGAKLCKKYQIPVMLSGGSVVKGNGKFPAWLVEIHDDGDVTVRDPNIT